MPRNPMGEARRDRRATALGPWAPPDRSYFLKGPQSVGAAEPRTVLMIQNVGLLTMGAGMVSLAQRYQFPLLILASYRGTPEDAIFYHIPKGRVTEPVLRGFGLRYAVAERDRPIGPQVERAATYAEESSSPFVLLLSREDIQW